MPMTIWTNCRHLAYIFCLFIVFVFNFVNMSMSKEEIVVSMEEILVILWHV
jgi:hypothetical protein